jgi:hypothetical protein
MSPARSRAIVLASSLLFASLVVTLARAQECGVRHEETVTGGSSNLLSVTSGTVQGVPYQLYLVAVSNRKDPSPSGQHAVTGVTGMGLTWQRLHTSPDYQCSQTGKTRVTVWWAVGTASVSSGPVTATFGVVGGDTSYTVTNAVIAVTRYSGIDPVVPFGAMIRGNTRGLSGSCGTPGITDTDNYQFPLVTIRNDTKVWCATAIRYASHTPGVDFVERAEVRQGPASGSGNGGTAGLGIQEVDVPVASTVSVAASISSATEWAMEAVEVHATPHPFLYFSATDLPWMRAERTASRAATFATLRAADSTFLLESSPTIAVLDQNDGSYGLAATKMASLAFGYVLDSTRTDFRDRALQFADAFVEASATRTYGGWDGTQSLQPGDPAYPAEPYDLRDTGLAWSLQWFAAVYDWLYNEIPAQPPQGAPYRSIAQYTTALNKQRKRLRAAIQQPYLGDWGNWWPNSWMQNHCQVDWVGLAAATWSLRGEGVDSLSTADFAMVADAMDRIKYAWDTLAPDGVWQEGSHYQTVGAAGMMHGFHMQQHACGVDNWPTHYLDGYADWLAANALDGSSKTFLVKYADHAGSDPPVLRADQGPVGMGASQLAQAHIAAAHAATPAQSDRLKWAAHEFGPRETNPGLYVYVAPDYLLEYLESPSWTSGSVPSTRRFDFPNMHLSVWSQGYTGDAYKVGIVGGAYGGDAGIAALPGYPWKPYSWPSQPFPVLLNSGHAHEDAGQYYFRRGHTELTTEYSSGEFSQTLALWHNVLLVDPTYNANDSLTNPKTAGQFDAYLASGGTKAMLDSTSARTRSSGWLRAPDGTVYADFSVLDLAPRYRTPPDESTCAQNQCTPQKLLDRYDRRFLYLRDVPGLVKVPDQQGAPPTPMLLVHDEIDDDTAHRYEWRHHSAVPDQGIFAKSTDASGFWRADCADGVSLAIGVGVPTATAQGHPFKLDVKRHLSAYKDALLDPKNYDLDSFPPMYLRVSDTVATASTHMVMMMYPVTTASWSWPSGPPPGIPQAHFDNQNSSGSASINWITANHYQQVNFMDDAAELNGLLKVDGTPHQAAGYLAMRLADLTIERALLIRGYKAAYEGSDTRDFILLNQSTKIGDISTRTDGAGKLYVDVTSFNGSSLPDFLDQALFYEHPSSASYITTVYVNGVNVDTETPRRYVWTHEAIGTQHHIRLAKYTGGSKPPDEYDAKSPVVERLALQSSTQAEPGGPVRIAYRVGGAPAMIRLEVFDTAGRRIRTLENGARGPGDHLVDWALVDGGNRVHRGIYFIRLQGAGRSITRKVFVSE